MRFTLLSIGDGLAWRVLGYDRAALAILGQGERVARFADGPGFEREVQEIFRFWEDDGVFALHNDLTTCLRHGDLTVRRNGSVELYEVKLSEHVTPDSPQMQRMTDAVTLLNEGRVKAPTGQAMRLHRIPLPFRTALPNLPALMAKTRHSGYATMMASPCQFVAAIDYRAAAGHEDKLLRIHEKAKERLGWLDGKQRTIEWFAAGRRMRDRRYSFAALAPLTIYPLPAVDVADLTLGCIDLYCILNTDILERMFAGKGIHATVATPPSANDSFLRAELQIDRRRLVIGINPQLREQMLLELMTPANVIGAVRSLAEALARYPGPDGEAHVVALENEARVWERGRA